MHFNYTDHARERMQNRKVTEFQIEQTVLNPDNWQYDEDDPQKYHAIKHWAHRTIEVVYISKIDAIKIITVFVL